MSSSHILIVDDEPDVCEVIQDRLKASGYQTHYVLNGQAALEYTKNSKPDLILLDIMMPGMDGYEVSKQLLTSDGTPAIPIIMLTAKQAQGDKVKALNMGADDYITKPYDSQELLARIESVLRRSKKRAPLSLSIDEENRIELLREMKKQNISKLEPNYNLSSQNGYEYPFAAKVLKKENGSEKLDLEILAEQKCLEKEFFDKTFLCPFCKHYNINLRETCPTCKSLQTKQIQMIHHFRCAYIGPEEEFKTGINYCCPKCRKELKHIGMDYDRVAKSYICLDCKGLFPETQKNAQCRVCKHIFPEENILRQSVYTYLLTPLGEECAKIGSFGFS